MAEAKADRAKAAANYRARLIRRNTRERIALITDGLESGDWRVLGYDTPAAWYAALTDYMLAPPDVRRRLAAAMRSEGYSLRRIATELDVSKDTAARDLGRVSDPETPGRVTGADGKSYPRSQPGHRENRDHEPPAPVRPPAPSASADGNDLEPSAKVSVAVSPVRPQQQPHCLTCTCFGGLPCPQGWRWRCRGTPRRWGVTDVTPRRSGMMGVWVPGMICQRITARSRWCALIVGCTGVRSCASGAGRPRVAMGSCRWPGSRGRAGRCRRAGLVRRTRAAAGPTR